MAAEYKLSYTAKEIDERLRKTDDIPTKLSELENDLPPETFVATYGETTYEQIKEAYEANKEVILIILNANDTDGKTIIARLVRANKVGEEYSFNFEGNENGVSHYAAIDPSAGWAYWNIDYMKEINIKRETFIATYGVTTYEEVAKAYYDGLHLYLNINKDNKNLDLTNGAKNCIATLTRAEGTNSTNSGFTFVCDENGISHHYSINYDTKKWFSWHPNWQKQIDEIGNVANNNAGKINKLLPLLTSSLNSFRGGFRNTAGTLDIKAPGIYIVSQGGTANKVLTITQNGTEVYKSPACNLFLVLSSDDGIVTPIGIKASLSTLGMFETPGTYQGWIKGETTPTHTTKITYPEMSVVWYLGNLNNDAGKWG